MDWFGIMYVKSQTIIKMVDFSRVISSNLKKRCLTCVEYGISEKHRNLNKFAGFIDY